MLHFHLISIVATIAVVPIGLEPIFPSHR
jgi:hypothetical protein